MIALSSRESGVQASTSSSNARRRRGQIFKWHKKRGGGGGEDLLMNGFSQRGFAFQSPRINDLIFQKVVKRSLFFSRAGCTRTLTPHCVEQEPTRPCAAAAAAALVTALFFLPLSCHHGCC